MHDAEDDLTVYMTPVVFLEGGKCYLINEPELLVKQPFTLEKGSELFTLQSYSRLRQLGQGFALQTVDG